MNYLENDHELYKVVKHKLPGQKKILKGFKKRKIEVLDLLHENQQHYKSGKLYETDFARIKKLTSELIDGYEKDIQNFEGHIADIEEFIEVYDRAYK
tara:strand:- start:780 stop:1070 length:291 start_codon:yes stop_codon:yes gene_type:complete